jgi:hypothetical protein
MKIKESEGHLCNTCCLNAVDRKATHRMEARLKTDNRNVHLYICDKDVKKWEDAAIFTGPSVTSIRTSGGLLFTRGKLLLPHQKNTPASYCDNTNQH